MFRTSIGIIQKRRIHVVPRLKNQDSIIQKGIDGAFSPNAIKTGWIDYQKYLANKLTLLTVGTDMENKNSYQIVKSIGSIPEFSNVFHYASQSHNNHLFWQQLIDQDSASQTQIAPELLQRIENEFGSLEEFQGAILTEADLLNGQGWVFLCEDEEKKLKIISCMNDGSPYFYGRNQSLDLNGPIHLSDIEQINNMTAKLETKEKDYNLPLLVINCWDFAYLEDYGVNGRADYLEKLWDCINWNVVNDRVFNVQKLSKML